jgi:hypothetical protein
MTRISTINHKSGFDGRECVAFDRVRRIGQFQILRVLKVSQAVRCNLTKPVEFDFLGGDLFQQVVHVLFLHGAVAPSRFYIR